jgi:hypothetical protein
MLHVLVLLSCCSPWSTSSCCSTSSCRSMLHVLLLLSNSCCSLDPQLRSLDPSEGSSGLRSSMKSYSPTLNRHVCGKIFVLQPSQLFPALPLSGLDFRTAGILHTAAGCVTAQWSISSRRDPEPLDAKALNAHPLPRLPTSPRA